MANDNSRRVGTCRCGQTEFAVRGSPLITMACHCIECQRMTASAFSLSALYPITEFNVVTGEPVIGGPHGETRHYCCPRCMSWLFTRPAGMDDLVNVRVSMFDDRQAFAPYMQCYTSEKLPWVSTPAIRSFEKFPSPDDFPALLSEYAGHIA